MSLTSDSFQIEAPFSAALIAPEQLPGALTPAEIDATMAYAEAEKAPATREAYASDWPPDFVAWRAATGRPGLARACRHRRRLPSTLAHSGRKSSTIGRAAAIGYRHKLAGHEPPTSAEGVALRARPGRPGAARPGVFGARAVSFTGLQQVRRNTPYT